MAKTEKRKCWRLNRFELPEQIRKIVNVKKEDSGLAKKLQQISNEDSAVLLAFIAPYGGVRVSPVEERGAAIRMPEEWGMESISRGRILRRRLITFCSRVE